MRVFFVVAKNFNQKLWNRKGKQITSVGQAVTLLNWKTVKITLYGVDAGNL